MAARLKIIVVTILCAALGYVLSYSPFLRFHPDAASVYYRSPRAYRPVEWLIQRTPLQTPLLSWAGTFEVRSRTEFQVWYFAQGTVDPSEEWHFNFQSDAPRIIPVDE